MFSCGIFTGDSFHYEWGNGCMERMREFIAQLTPGIIYVHNGGRFDFYYMLDWFDGKMVIINSRIIKGYGINHEWRDSAAIYPMPLKSFKKDDIDYRLLEANQREKHKEKIVEYMKMDCVYLHELVTRFLDEFGDNLTIGSTSMKQLKKLNKFDELSATDDSRIRNRYYYGGRVQCFEKGIITPNEGSLYVFDINQSYPTSMRNYLHPIGNPYCNSCSGRVEESTFFVTVHGYSHGCFPCRDSDGGLCFPIGEGIFHTTIHEYCAAIETGQFDTYKIIETVNFEKSGSFGEFVDEYHGLRNKAQLDGDSLLSNFYKLVTNSAYGKFAQCPDNYMEYVIKPVGVPVPGYVEDYVMGGIVLWSKPSEDVTRYNVATGASITGASRSMLIRALATAKRPVYCDTDSIICEGLGKEQDFDEYRLGAWKTEKMGDKFALAGRKLYALFDGDECVKMACKGVRLTPQEIVTVASGGKVTWKKDAPTFSLSRGTKFIHRDVEMT